MTRIICIVLAVGLTACSTDFKVPPPKCHYIKEKNHPCDGSLMKEEDQNKPWSCKKVDDHFVDEETTCHYFND